MKNEWVLFAGSGGQPKTSEPHSKKVSNKEMKKKKVE
jgi:hypothetical protein